MSCPVRTKYIVVGWKERIRIEVCEEIALRIRCCGCWLMCIVSDLMSSGVREIDNMSCEKIAQGPSGEMFMMLLTGGYILSCPAAARSKAC